MNIYMIFCTIVCTMIIAVSVLIGAVMVAVGLVNIIKERKKKMKDKIWLAPGILPEFSKDFIEEIIIEYEKRYRIVCNGCRYSRVP